MTRVDPTSTLGALVTEAPARATVLERLRLDYCCGGAQTLADACRARGLQLDSVLDALDAGTPEVAGDTTGEDRDWRDASIGELCAHIVAVHHDGLREAFPRIERLLATVARVHGREHPDLCRLEGAFGELRAELEPHLASEEDVLFPACRELELGGRPVDEALLSEHEREHRTAGDALKTFRVLADDYDPATALCTTHRTVLEELAGFERDLHRHVHEENNILMPRVRELASENRARSHGSHQDRDALPRCCQAWIAEQSHGWALHRG